MLGFLALLEFEINYLSMLPYNLAKKQIHIFFLFT